MNCKELNKDFESKKELFKELKANKSKIIGLKKAQILKGIDKNASTKAVNISKFDSDTIKSLRLDEDYYYLVVNSTGVLDSHNDLHIKGIWNKTVTEQQKRNYLVLDHEMTVSNTVVDKSDIEMLLMDVPFKAIGKDYIGNTQVLVYKFKNESIINETAKSWLESGKDIEASVRMQYVNIELAMNSDDEDDKEELKNYNNYIDSVANKNEFENIDYFWIVKEAKNIGESSLVLFGSNSTTGILDSKTLNEPQDSTQKNEPSDDTQKEELDYNYILNNL